VDWDAFRTGRGRAPAELSVMPRPRVGYVGNVDERVSVSLLEGVAAAMPDVTFVLVGPRRRGVGARSARTNLCFVPEIDSPDVPAVLHSFDVGMLPLELGTAVANPPALREMLAAGLPVVSTPLPEARRFTGLVHIARDADEWVAAVRGALREGRTRADERARAVREETWERRAEELDRFVGETVTAIRGGT
jgi:glycosyltransferase involved in cell wall biosynthesis